MSLWNVDEIDPKRVGFIDILQVSFTLPDPKSAKDTNEFIYFLRSAQVKAACKQVDEINPW